MKIFTLLTLVTLSLAIGLAAACSTAPNTGTTNQTKTAANTANAPATNSAVAPKKDEDAPASVKAAFPDATFTKQHKDLSKDQDRKSVG